MQMTVAEIGMLTLYVGCVSVGWQFCGHVLLRHQLYQRGIV